jgi:Tol biopolymer transport system component
MRKRSLFILAGLAIGIFVFSACGPWAGLPDPSSTPAAAAETTLGTALAVDGIAQPSQTLIPLVQPSDSPVPTVSNPTASSTPAPLLSQLTTGGCCVQPFWSPDGSQVLFVDRPSSDAPAGIYAVDLNGSPPVLFTERFGSYSNDMTLLAYPSNGQAVVERLSDGQRWIIPSDGRAISLSPDGTQVAWTAGNDGPPFDTPRREVWISSVDGSQPRLAVEVFGGGFAGWLPGGRMLFSGRLDPAAEEQGYFVWSPVDGSTVEIARASRLRGGVPSPQGTWLAYFVTLDEDPAKNGLWLADTQTGAGKRLDLFGAYRWRDDEHLLVVPLDLTSSMHRLMEVDASTGLARPLTDPSLTPLRIANGDWSVSPDGRRIAFVSAEDQNIWLLTLQ